MKRLTFEKWVKQYQPYQNPNTKEGSYNNCFFDTFQEVRDFCVNIPEFTKNQIWTLITGDNEDSWIISGLHVVNVMGYFVTRIGTKEDVEVDDNDYISVNEAKYKCKEFIEDFLGIELTPEQEDMLHNFWSQLK